MFDWKKPTVQMLGRWQPWHGGHQELFKRAYAITGQVLIMVRDVKGIGDNPFDFDEISKRIISELKKDHFTYRKEYDIMHIPNIINILNYVNNKTSHIYFLPHMVETPTHLY